MNELQSTYINIYFTIKQKYNYILNFSGLIFICVSAENITVAFSLSFRDKQQMF